MPLKGEIVLEFDKKTQEYLAFWEPVVIGMGKTRHDAIKDLTAAANLLLNTCNQQSNIFEED